MGHQLHARTWPAILGAVALVAAHAALFGVAFRSDVSIALIAVLVAVLVVKYAWRLRR